MTTVAYDGITLASDSQITEGTSKNGSIQKVFKLPDGSLFAGAGYAREINKVHRYLLAVFEEREVEKPELENFAGLLIREGKMLFTENSLDWFPIKAKYFAFGSGSDFALAAMECGKTAKEAVKLASRFDICTGGIIQTFKVSSPAKRTKKKKPKEEAK